MDRKQRILKIIELLSKEYPGAGTALNFKNPLEMLVATMLSAQCTDKLVNNVTVNLFKKYKTPCDYADADISELERDVYPVNFYKTKAKNIKAACTLIVNEFNSHVPDTMENLLTLPGVARKTANLVLFHGYGIISGIAVDTHVKRLSMLLSLTENKDPDKIERDLTDITPKDEWPRMNSMLVLHGRNVCVAKRPKCEICVLNKICPSAALAPVKTVKKV